MDRLIDVDEWDGDVAAIDDAGRVVGRWSVDAADGWWERVDAAIDVERMLAGAAAVKSGLLQPPGAAARHIAILRMRYGIGGGDRMLLKEVAMVECVVRERVRQMELEAIRRVRAWLKGERVRRLAATARPKEGRPR